MNLDGADAYNQFIEAKHAAESAMSVAEYDAHCDGTFTYFVYRYWSDMFPSGKQLLYVGFTRDFWSRDSIHRINSWWHHLVTRFDMDVYHRVTRNEARSAEASTIKAEVPLFNIHKNPRHDAVHGPQWTGANVERHYYAEMNSLLAARNLAADAQLSAPADAYAGRRAGD